MVDVPIQMKAMNSILEKFNEEEISAFQKYYGAHPSLLDGFEWFKNSERRPYVSKITEGTGDLTSK